MLLPTGEYRISKSLKLDSAPPVKAVEARQLQQVFHQLCRAPAWLQQGLQAETAVALRVVELSQLLPRSIDQLTQHHLATQPLGLLGQVLQHCSYALVAQACRGSEKWVNCLKSRSKCCCDGLVPQACHSSGLLSQMVQHVGNALVAEACKTSREVKAVHLASGLQAFA